MNAPFKRAGLGLACSVALLLAACGSSSSSSAVTSGPTLSLSQSQSNLAASLEPDAQPQNFYVHFTNATSEALASGGNLDNLQTLSLDATGTTGLLSLTPATTTTPGIYSLIINAGDSGGISTVIFNALVYPVGNLSGHPFILTFQPDATQPVAGVVGGKVTLPPRNALPLGTLSTVLVAPAGTTGITVDSTTTSLVSTPIANEPDAVTVVAHITVTKNSVTPGSVKPGTVTDASGTTYNTGLELTLDALPPSNGLSGQPYAESVYINNLSTL